MLTNPFSIRIQLKCEKRFRLHKPAYKHSGYKCLKQFKLDYYSLLALNGKRLFFVESWFNSFVWTLDTIDSAVTDGKVRLSFGKKMFIVYLVKRTLAFRQK